MTLHSVQGTVTLAKSVEVRQVEVLQAFKTAEEDFPFASCDNFDKSFKKMLAGCPVTEKVSIGHTKAFMGLDQQFKRRL